MVGMFYLSEGHQVKLPHKDSGLVFTNEMGGHLMPHVVYKAFKKIAVSIGCADTRFHDLRHPNVKPKTKSF